MLEPDFTRKLLECVALLDAVVVYNVFRSYEAFRFYSTLSNKKQLTYSIL
jgi:hypothetical protein